MSGQQTAGNGASVAAAEQAALLRYSNAAACAIREAGLQQGGGGGGGEMMVATGGAGADVTHVLSSLQQSSAEESSALVNSVLTQQPVFTTEGTYMYIYICVCVCVSLPYSSHNTHTHTQSCAELSGVMDASGVMTADPESLRFQYPLDEPPVAPKKKTTPTVYREQDRFLPINNVSRVMRNAIPRTGKVHMPIYGYLGLLPFLLCRCLRMPRNACKSVCRNLSVSSRASILTLYIYS